jgi:hypothetical protein
MSLEKKDVRAWLTPTAHAVAKGLADRAGKEINEFVSAYLERGLLGELDNAKVLVDLAERAGKCRDEPVSPGKTRTDTSSRKA